MQLDHDSSAKRHWSLRTSQPPRPDQTQCSRRLFPPSPVGSSASLTFYLATAITPSCCIRLRLSQTPRCSITCPSVHRKSTIPATVTSPPRDFLWLQACQRSGMQPSFLQPPCKDKEQHRIAGEAAWGWDSPGATPLSSRPCSLDVMHPQTTAQRRPPASLPPPPRGDPGPWHPTEGGVQSC